MPEISDDDALRGLGRFRSRAERDAVDPGRLRRLAGRAKEKMQEHGEQIGEIRDDLPVLLRVVRAYARGDYRRLPWRTLVTIVAGILYFVAPVDMIPDFIPVIGYVDDAAVIALVLRGVRSDLERFEVWEKNVRSPLLGV